MHRIMQMMWDSVAQVNIRIHLMVTGCTDHIQKLMQVQSWQFHRGRSEVPFSYIDYGHIDLLMDFKLVAQQQHTRDVKSSVVAARCQLLSGIDVTLVEGVYQCRHCIEWTLCHKRDTSTLHSKH
jgi:hypothetical protein